MVKLKNKYPREYRIWKAMRSRCNAPCNAHSTYQTKGIKVSARWDNFDNFIQDMGPAPSDEYSIDRIDNDKDYVPNNCRWATTSVQTKNRGSFNKLFTYKGETKVLKDWAREFGIKYNTLYGRIYRSGLTFEEAINPDPFNRLIEYQGRKQTMKDWCEELNLKYSTIIDRRHQGWSIERAFETPLPNN